MLNQLSGVLVDGDTSGLVKFLEVSAATQRSNSAGACNIKRTVRTEWPYKNLQQNLTKPFANLD